MRLAKAQAAIAEHGENLVFVERVTVDGAYKYVITNPNEPFPLGISGKDAKRKSTEMAHALAKKHNTKVVTKW